MPLFQDPKEWAPDSYGETLPEMEAVAEQFADDPAEASSIMIALAELDEETP